MASSSQPSPGINMSEAWLIKALRLLHSESQEDTARLRKMYKDACENESSISRISLADALRSEPSDENSGIERVPSRSRISAPSSLITSEGSVPSDPSSTSSAAGSKPPSKLINLFDIPTAPTSAKVRSSIGSANIIPVMVSQGKTIIADQSTSMIMTTADILGNTAVEANATPIALDAMEDLVADCRCCVCGLMIPASDSSSGETTKNNGLVECSRCGGLYHQLCHNPPLPTSRVPSGWICSRCSEASSSSPTKRPPQTSSSMETKKPKI